MRNFVGKTVFANGQLYYTQMYVCDLKALKIW